MAPELTTPKGCIIKLCTPLFPRARGMQSERANTDGAGTWQGSESLTFCPAPRGGE